MLFDQSNWGWSAMILPELDQRALYDQLNAALGTSNPGNESAPGFNAYVGSLSPSSGVATVLPVFRCAADNGSAVVELADSVLKIRKPYGRSNYPSVQGSDAAGWKGLSVNGAFPYYRQFEKSLGPPVARAIKDFTDGTSNSFLIGERISPGGLNGMHAGGDSVWAGVINFPDDVGGECKDPHRINRGLPPDQASQDQVNFSSRHGAGAHFLFGDGSVRYLSQTINMTVYSNLAAINDGSVICCDF
jgi:prepilin-type processing-associated H-X9-DG protein